MKSYNRYVWWLLLPVLAVVVGVGYQCSVYFRQQAAVEQIERLDGRVVMTHGNPRWLHWLTRGHSPQILDEATLVNLSQTKIQDADLIGLRKLNGLQRLNLSGTAITDMGLRHLAELTGLKALDLSGTQITGKGISQLRMLTALEFLYLGDTSVTGTDLQPLYGLTNLSTLDLTGMSVSEEAMAAIRQRLPGVEIVTSQPEADDERRVPDVQQ